MDPKEHEEKYQENLQGGVLVEYVRISNIPIRMKSEFTLMINRIIDLVGYCARLREDPYPLTWPRASGIGASTMAISVKMAYPFWTWFTMVGKNNLSRYSSENNTHIVHLRKNNETNGSQQTLDGTLALGPLSLPGLGSERESEKEPPEKESAANEKENRKENENEVPGVSYSQAVRGQKRSTDEEALYYHAK